MRVVDELVEVAGDGAGSDIHLRTDRPPMFRRGGVLCTSAFSSEQARQALDELRACADGDGLVEVRCSSATSETRWSGHVHAEGALLRRVPTAMPTFAELCS
jgi:Tfp pilus assembly pilus retraction ATPase PilT